MTSRITEIQALVAEIDSLLTNKHLASFFSSEKELPRQVLERIRHFLVTCEQTQTTNTSDQQYPQSSPLLTKFIGQNNYSSSPQPHQPNQQENSEARLTSAKNYTNDISSLLAPLQAELQTLLQERANLVQEIKELEQRRLQSFSLAQQIANQEQLITDFLQVLTNRLGVNFQPKISANLTNLSSETQSLLSAANSEVTNNTSNTEQNYSLQSQDQLERLANLAGELDQRILALDSTVNVVFDALQRNIQTYGESLSQALARMYSQGLQGEQLLGNLINNLIQQAQLQIASQEPFTIDIQKETLPTDLKSLLPNQLINQLETEVTQSIQPDLSSASLTNNLPADESQTVELDEVLLQLNQDTQKIANQELDQDNSILTCDEVDQLYASLFGTDNLIAVNPEFSSQLENVEIADSSIGLPVIDKETVKKQEVAELFLQEKKIEIDDNITETTVDLSRTKNQEEVSENIDSIELPSIESIFANPQESELILDSQLTTNEVQPTESTLTTSDPWFEQQDADLLEVGNVQSQDTQATNEITSEELFDLGEKITFPQENIDLLSLPLESPAVTDTVTSLTDLLFDVEISEQPAEIESVEDLTNTTTPITSLVKTEIIEATVEEETVERNFNDSSDNYIPASPQENLLLQTENQNIIIPEIALDAEQLLQLDEDLANFDEQISSRVETDSDLEAQEPIQEILASTPSSNPVVETEKKKEDTTDSSELFLPSHSQFIDDTEIRPDAENYVWYLGIDLGTTGISATLLNRSTTEVYPLYWSTEDQPQATSQTLTFRLPAEIYLPSAQEEQVTTNSNLFSAQLKPYLQIALPYRNEKQKWEPVLQFNEVATAPLVWIVRSLSKLLLTLKSDRSSTTLGLTAAAVGLNQHIFRNAIDNLAGVICTCPSHWSEQYRFNIREALLLGKIIQHPQQVFFIEEAIASLLSELDGASGEIIQFVNSQDLHPTKTSEHSLVGNTLVINIGASAAEMALVDLPESLEELTHSDFMLHSFAYAGKGIEQDIICQLLLPTKWRRPRNFTQEDNNTAFTTNPLHWQPNTVGIEQMSFASLGLETLKLPRPGEPDISDRITLQQRLESSFLGKAILDAAIALKLILQHQESFTLELADQCWILQRRDLESQVFVPFVRRLNRELNKLLVAKGIPTEAINQAILSGGTSNLSAVTRWLRQKLPNAKIIQDLYVNENGNPSCSRVAYGLAVLPLHPQVLEVPRQQYTDYFLFTELLRLLPDRALSFSEIVHLFEVRGINTRSCQQRLLAFLEGELPSGLIPNNVDFAWLNLTSRENFDYKAIASAPLFEKQGSLTYRPNYSQLQSMRRYLDAIKASTQQSLEEPYTVNFVIGAVN